MTLKTIEKFKNRYLLKNSWSKDLQPYLAELDFSKIISNRFKILESKVRLALIECLNKHNFELSKILEIIVKNQNKKITVIASFFKQFICKMKLFETELKDKALYLKNHGVDPTVVNLIQFYAGNFHKCKMCENLTLRIYCSQQCMGKDPIRKETYIQNMTSETAKLHREKTCLDLYGDKNVFGKNSSVVKDIRAENLRKYGGENVMNRNSPFRKIAEQTSLDLYGVKHFNNKQKTIKTNLKNLGVEYATQINFTNFDKLNKKYVEDHFIDIKKNRFLFNEFKSFFNLSVTVAYRYKKKFGFTMPSLHKRYSNPQKRLFDGIQAKNKLFNDRTIIKPLELDIVLPDIKLAIEFDGIYWHSKKNEPLKHLTKTTLCEKAGYQLFHIFDSDDLDIWKSMINAKLNLVKKIYARKCSIVSLSSSKAMAFCDVNHLQGGICAPINIGLIYEEHLVAVMQFGKPRFNKHYSWELLRYCQLKNTRVVGGAGRLLKHFRSSHEGKIISYANRRWSTGLLYKALGFRFVKNTSPGYMYVKNGQIYSRMSLQKHKLKSMKSYKDDLTGDEILKMEGYQKIFDCGNQVWEL